MATDSKKKEPAERGTTTVNISKEVHEKLKKKADKEGKKIGRAAEDLIKKGLEAEKQSS